MSEERFLDTLARTLAKPMPRRRALRLAMGALIGMAFPSAVASTARGGVVPGNHTCNPDGSESCRCFEGSAGPGTVMKATCQAGTRCECKTYTDPAYGPGTKYKIDCVKGTCREKKKVCGPDITNALNEALSRVKSEFAGWSRASRFGACTNLVTLPGAAISWDVAELGPGGREQFAESNQFCKTCGYSVQVGTDCHYSGSANYVVFGVMMRLCHDHYTKQEDAYADWFSSESMLELIYIHKNQTILWQAANFQASNDWALAGYNSGSVRPTPPGDRKDCQPCPKPYSGPGLTVRWLPFTIGPNR